MITEQVNNIDTDTIDDHEQTDSELPQEPETPWYDKSEFDTSDLENQFDPSELENVAPLIEQETEEVEEEPDGNITCTVAPTLNKGKQAYPCTGDVCYSWVFCYPDPESIQKAANTVWSRYRWRMWVNGGQVPVVTTGIKSNRRMASRNERPIVCPTNGRYYHTVTEAAQNTRTPRAGVWAILSGIRTHTKGYTFREATEQERETESYIGEIKPLLVEQLFTQSKAVFVNGKMYLSLNEACRSIGIGKHRLETIIKQGRLGARYATTQEVAAHYLNNSKLTSLAMLDYATDAT